jgi:hypothetical protein
LGDPSLGEGCFFFFFFCCTGQQVSHLLPVCVYMIILFCVYLYTCVYAFLICVCVCKFENVCVYIYVSK